MFGLGYQELLLILVIVLVLFGGSKLPDLAKSLGKSMKEFKKGIAAEPEEPSTPVTSTGPRTCRSCASPLIRPGPITRAVGRPWQGVRRQVCRSRVHQSPA
jgi:sec-independent protein translocase protein TatA